MTRDTQGTLAFRNADQRVLWECELMGQISDGQWENASPWDHWEAWGKAATIVDPTNVGREGFYPKRDSYGFTRREFLGVLDAKGTPDPNGFHLAGRAMEYVRLSRVIGQDDPALVRNVEFALAHPDHDNDRDRSWVDPAREVVAKFGADVLNAAMADEAIYSHKQLVADLRDMQGILKVVRKDTAALAREREERQRTAEAERRNVLTRYSVLSVALERANAELGTIAPTDEEYGIIKAQQEQLRDGRFRPRTDDIVLVP